MEPQQVEILIRLVKFLDLDGDGLRRFVLQSMVESREFTVGSLHDVVSQRFGVSRKVVASMTGYICSRMGILRMNKESYRSPSTYAIRDEYAEIARSALSIK